MFYKRLCASWDVGDFFMKTADNITPVMNQMLLNVVSELIKQINQFE